MNEDVKLAKWLDNKMDDSELQEFMLEPEYATYHKIKELSAQLTVPEVNMEHLYTTIEQGRNKNTATPKVRRLNPWLLRIAAVFILALGISFFLYTAHTTTQLAAAGERTAFLLPDNSEVVLNAGSRAGYKQWNWNSNRRITLQGEAYFKVAKGKTFDVVTPLGTVTVVGTQFNVKARNGRFDVTCFEGKVKVASGSTIIMLTPGKTITFENSKKRNLPDDSGHKPGWLTYETTFNEESLQNVISEMERQYKTRITLSNMAMPAKRFTGTVPMNDLDTALDIIKTVYHLQSQKTGAKIILSTE